jgi:cysteine-rich repeat protein
LFLPAEKCDDGNNVDGDGCSRMCVLENTGGGLIGDKFTCAHVFKDLKYEVPRYITVCERGGGVRRLLGASETEPTLMNTRKSLVHNTPYLKEGESQKKLLISKLNINNLGSESQIELKLFDLENDGFHFINLNKDGEVLAE